MPNDLPPGERGAIKARALRKQQKGERALELRREGHTYASIGSIMGVSGQSARNYCEYAYAEAIHNLRTNAALTLGGEIDRLDGLIRAATAVMQSAHSSPGEKVRAIGEIRRCQEAKVRWLGVGAADKITVEHLSRRDIARAEAEGLSDDKLDEELAALGYRKELPSGVAGAASPPSDPR